ncbi:hypothetical protein [Ureaplasma diversum]|uniref:Uncharacterized protein n=1 Tax=Ureaplasma diversum NCTC 246 TaxID=1188241 RepID=A0A084F1L4_9BACT|nr:hypothetical protein [Ureaplasma diversum]KEZ24106.1 Hypothetical protein, predicted transmembrane protein [Ureaplasma diversum NCTC 246]
MVLKTKKQKIITGLCAALLIPALISVPILATYVNQKQPIKELNNQTPTRISELSDYEQHIEETANDNAVDFFVNDWSSSFGYLHQISLIYAKQAINKTNKIASKKTIVLVPDPEFSHSDYYLNHKRENKAATRANWNQLANDNVFLYNSYKDTRAYKDNPPTVPIISEFSSQTIDYHLSWFDQDQKYNFYLHHFFFDRLVDQNEWYTILRMIKQANKIVLIPDGNAELRYSYYDYLKHIKNLKQANIAFDKQTLNQHITNIKNLKSDQELNNYYNKQMQGNISLLTAMFNSDLFVDIGIEPDFYKTSAFSEISDHLYPIIRSNLNFKSVADKLLLTDDARVWFINKYQSSFFLNDKKLTDFIISKNKTIDINKPNLVFVGSSLFYKEDPKNNEHVYKELRAWVAEIKKKYPNANHIFKLHPIFNVLDQEGYIRRFFDEENIIILSSTIPFENLLLVDYYNHLNNKNDFSFLNQKTYLWGFQPTTSLIVTSTYILNSLDYNNKALDMFDLNNFLVAQTYDVVKRGDHKIGVNYKPVNIKHIDTSYKPLVELKKLKPYKLT